MFGKEPRTGGVPCRTDPAVVSARSGSTCTPSFCPSAHSGWAMWGLAFQHPPTLNTTPQWPWPSSTSSGHSALLPISWQGAATSTRFSAACPIPRCNLADGLDRPPPDIGRTCTTGLHDIVYPVRNFAETDAQTSCEFFTTTAASQSWQAQNFRSRFLHQRPVIFKTTLPSNLTLMLGQSANSTSWP